MYGGDERGKLYFLFLKLIKRKKNPVLGEVPQLILSSIVVARVKGILTVEKWLLFMNTVRRGQLVVGGIKFIRMI